MEKFNLDKERAGKIDDEGSQLQKESKIFIAGHRGLVGSAIVRHLQQKGYQTDSKTVRKDAQNFLSMLKNMK